MCEGFVVREHFWWRGGETFDGGLEDFVASGNDDMEDFEQ